ncbi:UvrD-helicase domain-containing protein [Aquimarina hainanensis]|uniref:DNA 3'-5' helicase n=1 Tax=Aquimarina hainanensis TaxID=1578017 RepID=A0ABW5N192_9FLAO
MNNRYPFVIYNAAAGAGKTYTLVKAYLMTLLTGAFNDGYRNILAITFTNKAVAEMKTRVLESLIGISEPTPSSDYQLLLEDIAKEISSSPNTLKKKARKILESILHNYAAFDIVTIDTFTHRVIRTFSHDLGIPMNFEIEMDTEVLIEEAVDAVVAKVGEDKELTKVIVEFAFGKMEEDKSWDVTLELNKIARLLFSENDRKHLQKLSQKSASDFDTYKKELQKKYLEYKEVIISQAKKINTRIQDIGLDQKDFLRGSVPKYFEKLAAGDISPDFNASWKQTIDTTPFYGAKLDAVKKDLIDEIRPEIEQCFLETKNMIIKASLFDKIIKNLTPLSVLNAIHKELQEIKKERRILLISEFNTIISEAIQDQPAPFIYERLGERYRDYFIDEFQDTSEMQWNNLIPLIDNALSSETLDGKRGSLTVVGDAKQAIYRWRGGKAEQFIELSLEKNPFSIEEKEVMNLPRNYRSHKEVILFNNNLFTFLSNDFSNLKHKELYLTGNQQEVNTKKGGYVNVSFVEAKNIEEEHIAYAERTYAIVSELVEKGYALNDICILTRRQKEGVSIADYLTEKDIPIISSETLLINKATEVQFIVNLLIWYVYPKDFITKTKILHFIISAYGVSNTHAFLEKHVFSDRISFSKELQGLGIYFDFEYIGIKPLYEAVEYIIRCFSLGNNAPAYVQFFLDIVFSFTQKNTEGLLGFLTYWEVKKDTISIIAPEGEEAVTIMTIHKSKGLEFPCVIYPFANTDFYREIEPKTWFPVEKEQTGDFDEVLINYNKDIEIYGTTGKEIVEERKSQLELDAFNVFYVAMTRAEQQLYVVSKLELNTKGMHNPNKISGKLIAYLQHIGEWNEARLEYGFGVFEKTASKEEEKTDTEKVTLHGFDPVFKKHEISIVTNAGKLWDTSQKEAQEKGTLLHELMSRIQTKEDVEDVITKAYLHGEIGEKEKSIIQDELIRIIMHPGVLPYFQKGNTVLNERSIMSGGREYRPDRVVIDANNRATIIDYKTGGFYSTHAEQVYEYGQLIEELGYFLYERVLIYVNESITLKYV